MVYHIALFLSLLTAGILTLLTIPQDTLHWTPLPRSSWMESGNRQAFPVSHPSLAPFPGYKFSGSCFRVCSWSRLSLSHSTLFLVLEPFVITYESLHPFSGDLSQFPRWIQIYWNLELLFLAINGNSQINLFHSILWDLRNTLGDRVQGLSCVWSCLCLCLSIPSLCTSLPPSSGHTAADSL